MTKAIKELTINDHIYRAKGTFKFGQTAKQYAENEVDDKGKERQGDGVTTIFIGLMQQDPDALVKFWHCGTAHYLKDAPSFDDIAQAIEDIADKEDLNPYFVGALTLLNEGGYYKGKLQTLWFMMKRSAQKAKGEDKEETKDQIEMFTEMYEAITGKKPFENKA
ncbi:tail assembly chaperone [Salinicoccus albus]|uniref:tail assembly chaperone n=1 Tax=Salinicoccus albus TaxID=418756 RepID=UPI00036B2D2F|nr:tail assembly chaperone [Salinicoccus albus]